MYLFSLYVVYVKDVNKSENFILIIVYSLLYAIDFFILREKEITEVIR